MRRRCVWTGPALALALLGCGDRPSAPLEVVGPSAGCRPGMVEALRRDARTLEVDGEVRSYVLDVPAGSADEPRPMVLAFHGFGARGARLRRNTWLGRMAHRRGFIGVFPDGRDDVRVGGRTGRGWGVEASESTDVDFVRQLIDRLGTEWCVDRDRVYVTGMSNGAAFASRLGCRLAERIAGVAAVAGAQELGRCHPTRPVPILLIHGRGDRVVPVEAARAARDWWVDRNGCGEPRIDGHCQHFEACSGAPVSYCEAGQGHVWPRPASRRIVTFFDLPLGPRGGPPAREG